MVQEVECWQRCFLIGSVCKSTQKTHFLKCFWRGGAMEEAKRPRQRESRELEWPVKLNERATRRSVIVANSWDRLALGGWGGWGVCSLAQRQRDHTGQNHRAGVKPERWGADSDSPQMKMIVSVSTCSLLLERWHTCCSWWPGCWCGGAARPRRQLLHK